jgi:hypothetical protein
MEGSARHSASVWPLLVQNVMNARHTRGVAEFPQSQPLLSNPAAHNRLGPGQVQRDVGV